MLDIQKNGDPQTHSPEMDYEALERSIGPRTKAIIAADLAGLVCDYDRIFDPNGEYRLDVLLTPSTPTVAFSFNSGKRDSVEIRYADQFTSPLNFAGTPGISFPVGSDSEGLPIGIQAVGYDFCESKILRAAHAAEQALIEGRRL